MFYLHALSILCILIYVLFIRKYRTSVHTDCFVAFILNVDFETSLRAFPLLRSCLILSVQHHLPCVKGEGEVGDEREGEGEGQSLACQRMAEVHALDGQGGVPFRHRSSHSQVLLLNYTIDSGDQLN